MFPYISQTMFNLSMHVCWQKYNYLLLCFQLFSILMVIGVGQLVQHSLASYGMYLFSGALLLAALIMCKSYSSY